jgi:hypothetical protein
VDQIYFGKLEASAAAARVMSDAIALRSKSIKDEAIAAEAALQAIQITCEHAGAADGAPTAPRSRIQRLADDGADVRAKLNAFVTEVMTSQSHASAIVREQLRQTRLREDSRTCLSVPLSEHNDEERIVLPCVSAGALQSAPSGCVPNQAQRSNADVERDDNDMQWQEKLRAHLEAEAKAATESKALSSRYLNTVAFESRTGKHDMHWQASTREPLEAEARAASEAAFLSNLRTVVLGFEMDLAKCNSTAASAEGVEADIISQLSAVAANAEREYIDSPLMSAASSLREQHLFDACDASAENQRKAGYLASVALMNKAFAELKRSTRAASAYAAAAAEAPQKRPALAMGGNFRSGNDLLTEVQSTPEHSQNVPIHQSLLGSDQLRCAVASDEALPMASCAEAPPLADDESSRQLEDDVNGASPVYSPHVVNGRLALRAEDEAKLADVTDVVNTLNDATALHAGLSLRRV